MFIYAFVYKVIILNIVIKQCVNNTYNQLTLKLHTTYNYIMNKCKVQKNKLL